MADDDEIEPTHDKILRRYGWAEGEREQLMAEMAERQREIDREGLAREAEPADVTKSVVTKSAPPARTDTQAMTHAWEGYIAGEVRAAERRAITAVAEAVGEVLAEERKRAAAELAKMQTEFESRLQSELLKLRNEILQSRLDSERQPAPTQRAAKRVTPETAAEQRQRATERVRRRQALAS